MQAVRCVLASLILMITCVRLAAAQEEAERVYYDVPALPAEGAVKRIAVQSNRAVLFRAENIADVQANAVKGYYSVQEALAAAFLKTPLQSNLTDKGAIVVSLRNDQGKKGNMNTKIIKHAFLTSVATFLFGAGANAQDTEALSAGQEQDEKEDVIVVTGLRRGETEILDTPLSVSAFGGDELEKRGLAGINDFIQLAPGATLISNAPGSNRIQLRGIAGDVGESSIGYYLDEVPMAFINQSNLPDFRSFDLERVEILRGPQGTLYGAGAVAGVVRTITRPPVLDDYEAKGDFSYSATKGGQGNYETNIALNAPIIPGKLAVRGVYIQENLGGWIDQTTFNIKNYNDTDTKAFRVKVRGKLSDQFEVSALYWGSRVKYLGNNRAFDDGTIAESARSSGNENYDIYNFTANYGGDNITVISSTSYSKILTDKAEDFFGGFTLDTVLDPSTFTQELRVYSVNDSPWQWSAGGFYRNAEQTQSQDSEVFPQFNIDPILQFDKVESWNLFGELTRSFFDGRLEATAGVRYLNEVRRSEQKVRPSDPYENKFNAWAPRFNLTFRPNDNVMTYFNYGRGVRSGINQFAVSLETAAAFGVFLPSEIDPEFVDSYEIGAKGTLFGDRVTFDLAAFLINWKDRQITVPILQFVLFGIVNASKVQSPGVEGALNWKATNDLTLGVIGSWNGAGVKDDVVVDVAELDFTTGLPSGNTVQELVLEDGSRVNGVPKYTVGGMVDYSRPISANIDLLGNATFQYAAPNITSGPGFMFSGAKLLRIDARAGIGFKRGAIYVFGRNLTNEDGAVSKNGIGVGARYRPRTIGVNLKLDL